MPELGIAWTDFGAGGLVVLVVLMILTGRLVPRQVYKDMEAQRDLLMQTNKELQATIENMGARIDAHGEVIRTVERLMQALMNMERSR